MAYGIPERAAMIALMALNKETPNAELRRRYGIDVRKAVRVRLNQDGLLQSRRRGAKGYCISVAGPRTRSRSTWRSRSS